MRLPPHTPQQLRHELARRPSLRRRIARGWIVIGSIVAVGEIAMAVAHYAYGAPVHDGGTGQLLSPIKTLAMFLLIGGGGTLFVVIGTMLLRWKPD